MPRKPTLRTLINRAKRAGWADRIVTKADEKALLDGCYFDATVAEQYASFFPAHLRHSKGKWAGKPFELMAWERSAVEAIFGWRRADGTRRFRSAYIEIPKKNGKSTFGAGIGLLLTAGDNEPGAEVYSVGKAEKQAQICWREARNMVKQSAELSKWLRVMDSTHRIVYDRNASFYATVSSEAGLQEGLNIHGLIGDEMHVWDRKLWETLKYGGAAREQPLLFLITTAGVFDVESVGWELHDYGTKILNGTIDDWARYVAIYAADPDADWTVEETWEKANPSYGVTIDPAVFAEECREAQESPAAQNSFKRYRLNLWTQQAERWLDIAAWDRLDATVSIEDFAGQAVYGGLDLANTGDLCALCLMIEDDDGAVRGTWRFWLPEHQASEESRSPNKELYRNWAEAGFINLTPGNVTDYAFIRKEILVIAEEYDLQELGYDPWNATHLVSQLIEDGINMVQVRPSMQNMSGPMKHLQRIVMAGELAHDGNQAQRFCVDNVACKEDTNENIRPIKMAAANKIDGVVAGIIALGRLIVNADGGSVYVEEGAEPIMVG